MGSIVIGFQAGKGRSQFGKVLFVTLMLAGIAPLLCAPARAESSSAPVIGVSSKAGPYRFKQKVVVNLYRGLPTHLGVTVLEGRPAKIRAVMELDGRTVIFPLKEDEPTGAFTTFFPTPKQSVKYRLQFTDQEGKAVLSDFFGVDPQCSRLEAAETVQTADKFPEQRRMLEEALAVDRELDVLKYLIYSVDEVLKYEK